MAEPASFRIDPISLGVVTPDNGKVIEFPARESEYAIVDFLSLARPYASAGVDKSRYNVESFAKKDGGGYHPEMHFRIGDARVSYGCDFNAEGNPTWGIITADKILYRTPGTTDMLSVNLLSALYGDRGEIDQVQLQWYGESQTMPPVTEVTFSKDNPTAISIASRDIAGGDPVDAFLGETIYTPGNPAAFRVDHGQGMFSVARVNLSWDSDTPVVTGFDIATVSEHLEGISSRLRSKKIADNVDFLSRYPVGIAFDQPPHPAMSELFAANEAAAIYH